MSLNQSLIIHKFPVLFNILNEIKYILNFKIEYFDSVQFIKNKFNQQNNIKTGKYRINLNSRVMQFEKSLLQLTEKEVKIINFLNNSKEPVTISKLQSEVWGYKSKLETHTVETHVYRLRKKVEKKFSDKLFIKSLKNGYKIES